MKPSKTTFIYLITFLILFIGCISSLSVWGLYRYHERQNIFSKFERLADIRLLLIKNEMEETVNQLNSIKKLFQSSENVTLDEFKDYTKDPIKLFPNIQFLGWIGHSRDESVSENKKTYLNLFLSPAETHKKERIGFDYISDIGKFNSLEIDNAYAKTFSSLIQDSKNRLVISHSILFQVDGIPKRGFFFIESVYENKQRFPQVTSPDTTLRGVLVGLSDFQSIVMDVRKKTEISGLATKFYEYIDGVQVLAYENPGSILPSETGLFNELFYSKISGPWIRQKTINVGDHLFTIQMITTPVFFEINQYWAHWEVILVGFIFSGITSLYFFLLNKKQSEIENEVKIRTEELAQTNQFLQLEIHERQRVEEDLVHKKTYLEQRHLTLEAITKLRSKEITETLQTIILKTAKTMQVNRVGVWLDEETENYNLLTCVAMYSEPEEKDLKSLQMSSIIHSNYYEILKTLPQITIPTKINTLVNAELTAYLTSHHILSKLDIPIIFEGKMLGILSCEQTTMERKWILEDLHFGQTIADFIAILIEQAARKKVEKALATTQERLHFITQKANDAIVIINDKKALLSWNEGAERMFGYSESEAIGMPVCKILLDFINDEKFGPTKPVEFIATKKDGSTFPTEISLSRWESGHLTFDTIVIRDITERKENEKKLIRAMKEARSANEAKSEFLTVVSHEFRTPLNAIIGFNQCLLMEMDGPINDIQRDSLKKIEKSSFHLLTLINNFLDFSRIEAKRTQLEIQLYDIVEIVQTCTDEMQPLINEKNLSFVFSSDFSSMFIEVDKTKIIQVILNLLGNAVKFTEKGEINVRLIEEPDLIIIQIQDTGIGLTEIQKANLFKPFSQADSSITRRYGGSGLGLAISKKMMELLGGRIELESKLGKGSTFKLFIPKHTKNK